MKIINKRERQVYQLKDVQHGECFLFESSLYLAVEETTDRPANRLCVRLRDGHAVRLLTSVEVESVDAEVTYR